MNWNLLLPLLVTTTVASVGWIIAHRFEAVRDQKNKRREIRLGFLIEAYRRFEAAARCGIQDSEVADNLESAIVDVQLLGTADQSKEAKDLAQAIKSSNSPACAASLLYLLREDLRRELNLEPLGKDLIHFKLRVTGQQKQ